MTASQKVALNIKLWRVRKNITQSKLAKVCQLSQSYFSRLEAGQENPTLDTLDRVAAGLGVPLDALMKEDNPGEEIIEQAA